MTLAISEQRRRRIGPPYRSYLGSGRHSNQASAYHIKCVKAGIPACEEACSDGGGHSHSGRACSGGQAQGDHVLVAGHGAALQAMAIAQLRNNILHN